MIVKIIIIIILIWISKDVTLCQCFTIEEKIKIFHEFLTLREPEFYKWLVTQFSVIDINLEFLESKEEIQQYAKQLESKYLEK